LIFSESFESTGGSELDAWIPQVDSLSTLLIPSTCPGGGKWALQLTPDPTRYRVNPLPEWIDAIVSKQIEGLEAGDIVELTAWVRRDPRTKKGQASIELQRRNSDVYSVNYQLYNRNDKTDWHKVTVREEVKSQRDETIHAVLRAFGPPGCAACFDRVELRRLESKERELSFLTDR
jgi:hypothetical protein